MSETKKINATPLGLFGFGFTTILLNLHNVGLFAMSPVILAMGIVFGGFIQIIAGKIEFQQGNNFGGVVFNCYGAFWLTLVLIWILPIFHLANPVSPVAMGYYLVMWGILTAVFFVQTFSSHTVSKLIFSSLTILFFLLAIADFLHNPQITILAGTIGIICGSLAVYEAAAVMINERYGKTVLPL